MKPRTKLQLEVLNLSKYYIDSIKNEVLSWAKVSCLDHKGFSTKSRVVCMDCGESFSTELVNRKRAVCPHCGSRLKVEQTRKTTDEQRIYVAKAEIYKEFQVIRNFEISKYSKRGKESHYFICEVLQHWIKNDGKREVVAMNHHLSWNCDSWTGELEIRDKNYRRYWEAANRYDIYPCGYHPDSVFLKDYQKYGINSNLKGLTFLEAINIIPKNTKAETLLKTKQYSLLSSCENYEYKIRNFWPSIKICIRNNYIVKDASMYFDYLDLLDFFKKDLHSSHYVCPRNLKKEHDVLVKRKSKIMEIEQMKRDYARLLRHFGHDNSEITYPKNIKSEYRILLNREKVEKIERKKKELEEVEINYKKFIETFSDLEIKDNIINISPLKSIEEFKEEGTVLDHCVYSNEYFKKEDCLILSSKIGRERLETIEIDLKQMKIIQCRGKSNQNTSYHDRIVNLVNKNINVIRKRVTA